MATQKTQTKLAAKLRRYLKDADPDIARQIEFAANQLDFAKLSLGDTLSKGGTYYHAARKLYCLLSGKAWGWEAEDDLENIPVAREKTPRTDKPANA